jgi:branched-chain amino acid transport system permease protein
MSRIVLAVLVVALLAVPLFVHNQYFLHVMIVIGINVIMAVSMWLLGITGLISFGQAGFMFIGAMTTALLTKNAGWPFWVALPLSAAVAGAVSAPVGRLSLRVKGVYFFLVTLAFGQVVAGVFAYFENPFGGWYGIRNIPPPQPRAFFGTLEGFAGRRAGGNPRADRAKRSGQDDFVQPGERDDTTERGTGSV